MAKKEGARGALAGQKATQVRVARVVELKSEKQLVFVKPEVIAREAQRSWERDSELLQNRALRRLHIRFYHCTAAQLISLLRAAGVRFSR